MDYYTRLLWRNKMHSEIYNSDTPFEEKIRLQSILDQKHKGNFRSLLQDILEYAVLPDIEEYEKAAEIRDYLNK